MDQPVVAVWKRPEVLRLLLIALAAELGFAVLNISVMPVFLESRGMSGKVISAVFAVFLLSEALLKGFAGHWADVYGRRVFLVLAPCLMVVTPLLTLGVPQGAAYAIPAFIGLRIVDGLAAAMIWPALYAAVGESVDVGEKAQGMSLLNVCFMIGLATGPLVGGLLNDRLGSLTPSFYLASALFAGTALVAVLFTKRDSRKHRLAQGEELEEHGLRDLWACAKSIPAVLILAIAVFFGAGILAPVIKLMASRIYGLSETEFGLLLLPAALAMAFLGVPLGRWAEKIGSSRAVQLGLAISAIGMWFVATGAWLDFARGLGVLGLAGALVGVGFLVAIPAWQAFVSHINPKKSGSFLGAVMTAQGIGAIIGVPIGGALYDADTYLPVIACAAVLSICAAVSPLAVPSGSNLDSERSDDLDDEPL
jgi:DHA1 family multidrug resistance protein-like MFS transporter